MYEERTERMRGESERSHKKPESERPKEIKKTKAEHSIYDKPGETSFLANLEKTNKGSKAWDPEGGLATSRRKKGKGEKRKCSF